MEVASVPSNRPVKGPVAVVFPRSSGMSDSISEGPDVPPDPHTQAPHTEIPLLAAGEIWLAEESPPRSPAVTASPNPGVGLLESGGWLVGFFLFQVLGAAGMAGVLWTIDALVHGRLPKLNSIEGQMVALVGGGVMATALFSLLAVIVRYRPGGLKRLGLRGATIPHTLLVIVMVIPLSLLCSDIMNRMIRMFPASEGGMLQVLKQMAEAPLWLLLLVMAAGPALSEELLFRGLIGRGLVSRYGVVFGVLLTSTLFGIVHMVPAQAVAVIPMGIAMHYVYLTTRSFWAPVMLHFLNNAWAALMLKYPDSIPFAAVMNASAFPPELLAASAAVVITVLLLLWQTRVGDQSPEMASDPFWQRMAVRESATGRFSRPLLACGAFNLLGFVTAMWRLATGG